MKLIDLYRNEAGFIVSTELLLVSTLLVIGLVVGHSTLRDQVITEVADSADAISALDQSFTYSAINVPAYGSVAGTTFSDAADFCDSNDNGAQGVTNNFTGTCVTIDANDPGAGTQSPVNPGTAN